MKKNGEATDLLDTIMKAAPKLPLRIKTRYSVDGYLQDPPVQDVYPADVAPDDVLGHGIIQVREYGDIVGTTLSWANYIALSGNALPLLLEVVNAALGSKDESVRVKAEAASQALVKIVQQIAEESVVEVEDEEELQGHLDTYW